jgi:hypothetical protein
MIKEHDGDILFNFVEQLYKITARAEPINNNNNYYILFYYKRNNSIAYWPITKSAPMTSSVRKAGVWKQAACYPRI